jgi:hypothetical protein
MQDPLLGVRVSQTHLNSIRMNNLPNAWQLTEDQMWALSLTKGSQFNILTKRGKIKTVTVVNKKGMNGNYNTFQGAEYLSIMEEWHTNQLERGKLFNFNSCSRSQWST